MAVCGACGTENREKARYCRGCAAPLVASTAPAPVAAPVQVKAPAPTQTCPGCRSSNSLAATACTACGASLVPDLAVPQGAGSAAGRGGGLGRSFVTGFVLVAVFAGAWWFQSQGQSAPAAPGAVQASSPLEASPAQPVAAVAPPAAIEQKATPFGPPGDARTRVVGLDVAGKTEPKPAALRDRSAAERQRPVPAAAPRPVEPPVARLPVAQAPAVADASSAAQPAEAVPAMAVDQRCAGSSNFITRDLCRVRACRDAANSSDPVCIRFRQMEEANRREPAN